MPDRKLVLVAGTGRSGTSTLVGLLQRHGFHVPQPEVAPDDTNPRGFGEPRWVVDLHGRLLRQAKVQVADSRPAAWEMAATVARDEAVRDQVRGWLEEQLGVADRLVVKDPRSLWFLPLWTDVARELDAEPSFVTMLRPPPETVGSRRTYYNRGLEDPHGIASWLNLMTGTEHATRGHRRSFVRYHDLLDDWSPVTEQLWRRNGLGDSPPTPSEDPGDFIDPGLRRMRLTWDDLELPERLATLATEASDALDALAADRGRGRRPARAARPGPDVVRRLLRGGRVGRPLLGHRRPPVRPVRAAAGSPPVEPGGRQAVAEAPRRRGDRGRQGAAVRPPTGARGAAATGAARRRSAPGPGLTCRG